MKKLFALLVTAVMLFSLSSCSIPIISDFIDSEESLGKTNNTAVAIAEAMKEFLKNKKHENLSLYAIELVLNSDGNGTVKLYYSAAAPAEAVYSDIHVAEVDSKTGHVERFSKVRYEVDGLEPYRLVKENEAFDGGTLPVDSEKAISTSVRAFSNDIEFHYDYAQILLTAPSGVAQYDVRFISMLNEKEYRGTVDAVSGALLKSSVEKLSEEGEA